jgi:hypothetical protein
MPKPENWVRVRHTPGHATPSMELARHDQASTVGSRVLHSRRPFKLRADVIVAFRTAQHTSFQTGAGANPVAYRTKRCKKGKA